MSTLIYAGIGSRQTPPETLKHMRVLAQELGLRGHTLRSGGADGADRAFERGCDDVNGKKEIYLPWHGFNGYTMPGPVYRYGVGPRALALAEQHHPAWSRCGRGARALHARNGYQVLGANLATPADFVICWTPNASASGGTGQAIRIAKANGIPVFDLADPEAVAALVAYSLPPAP